MWSGWRKYRWIVVLMVALALSSACSAHRHDSPQDDWFADSDDPFDDPFFTHAPEWDNSVLQQSEVIAESQDEPERPKTFAERSQEVVFSTLLVGASLGQLALPFFGLGF